MPSKCSRSGNDRVMRKSKIQWFVTETGESSSREYTIRDTDSFLHVIAKSQQHAPLEIQEGYDIPQETIRPKSSPPKKRKQRTEGKFSTDHFQVSSIQNEDGPDPGNKSDHAEHDEADMSETDSISHDVRKATQVKRAKMEQGRQSNIQFYSLENSDSYIVHMPLSSTFSFLGKIQITLLHGQVTVFGYTLNESSRTKTLDLYSPRRCMSLSLTSNPPQTPLSVDAFKETFSGKHSQYKLLDVNFTKLLTSLEPTDTLLLVSRLTSSYTAILNHYYNEFDLFYEKQVATSSSRIEQSLMCSLDASGDRKSFTVGGDWTKIRAKGCTVLCGGKGVGKSTLLKYLINSALSVEERVLCLDLDPGQTEFTSPGCLSAAVVKLPLLGPNFTHIIDPEKMAYLGDVNVGLDPSRYMQSVAYIVECCRRDPELSRIPWFINTMGFSKGIGLDIMVNILRLVRPNVVIQICSSERVRNYEYQLTPSVVDYLKVAALCPVEAGDLSYDFYRTSSCARHKGIGFQIGFIPSDIRELMMLSYFSHLLTFPYCSLNAIQPQRAKISELLFVVNSVISPSDIFKAFNGSVVALCSKTDLNCELLFTSASDVKVGINPGVVPCLGLGIVRCIDLKEMTVYIITHLPDDAMKRVDCLAMGNLAPPTSIYIKQLYVDGPGAYTEVGGVRNFRGLKRSFRYLPRTA